MIDIHQIKRFIKKGELDKLFNQIPYSENKEEILDIIIRIGINYSGLGNLEKALEIVQRASSISEKQKIPRNIAYSFSGLGYIYATKGELGLAHEYLKKGRKISENAGSNRILAWTLMCIGYTHFLQGDLDESFNILQKSLELSKKSQLRNNIAWCMYHMAKIYKAKNELNNALDYFNISLEIFRETNNIYGIGNALLRLVLTSIDLKANNKAKEYLKEFNSLEGGSPSWIITESKEHLSPTMMLDTNPKAINLCMRLSRALLLKSGNRAIHKTDAQRLLRQIVDETILDWEYTLIAMINLCDLLIDELKNYEEEEVFREAEELTHKIYKIAKDQNSHIILIETLLLKSRFALVREDVDNAYKYLDEAYIHAMDKKYNNLIVKVKKEQEFLNQALKRGTKLVQKGTSLIERLNQAEVKEYVLEAKKIVEYGTTRSCL